MPAIGKEGNIFSRMIVISVAEEIDPGSATNTDLRGLTTVRSGYD